MGLKFRDKCKQHFINLKIMTVPCTYVFHCLKFTKKNLNKYTTRDQIHSYGTRNYNILNNDFLRLTKTRNGTGYYCIKFYNALPLHVRLLPEKPFILRIKKYLLNNAFYSTDEFLNSNLTSI